LVLDSSLGEILPGTETLAFFCAASIMVCHVGRAGLGYGSMAAGCPLHDAADVDSGCASVGHGPSNPASISAPRNCAGWPELLPGHPEQRLVTSGVRHPVYLAHVLEILAWSTRTGLAVLYGLSLFALISGFLMIGMQDAELEQRFGAEYREYRSRVPAIVPRAFS
jgi:hypothetical protein